MSYTARLISLTRVPGLWLIVSPTRWHPPLVDKLQGIVEAVETHVGGKARGMRGHGAANKTPVVTPVERNGEARSQVCKP